MRSPIAGLLARTVLPAAAEPSTPENHCRDKVTNQRWEELVAEHHGSNAIQRLYALQLGLCVQVERGMLRLP